MQLANSNVASIKVHLDTFEGPLSLLLYLIKKSELDIYDIPINEITNQYLEYIQIMKELNLEVAGEFIAMAATLIYIKSRMLVPQYDEHGEEIEDDPRKELVKRLLEYQKFQEAGKQLYRRPLLGRDTWLRGRKEALPRGDEEIVIDDKGLFSLISAFRQLQKQAIETPHTVKSKGMSISARLIEIKDKFKLGARIELMDLLSAQFTRVELLITFLSVLELSRLGYTRVYQTEPFQPLYIETIKEVSAGDIVNRVQEFDDADAANTAEKLMIEAEADLKSESIQEFAESHVDVEHLEEDPEVMGVESGEIV